MKAGILMKLHPLFNWILGLLLIVSWTCVLILHGISGAASWALIKLILAPAGLILTLIWLLVVITKAIRKRPLKRSLVTLALSVLLALPILILFGIVPVAYPVTDSNQAPAICIQSPFSEPVTIGWGGVAYEDNIPHVQWASERWAYDLVREPYDTGATNLEDYGIYGMEVYAPVAGVVVSAFDSEDDILPNTSEFLSLEGNHVYLKIDETDTFLLMNHLKKGSVQVKVGDHVSVGDYLGQVGNSGSTSEPHLHIHHQRQDPTKTLHPTIAEGLPLFFKMDGAVQLPVKGTVLTP